MNMWFLIIWLVKGNLRPRPAALRVLNGGGMVDGSHDPLVPSSLGRWAFSFKPNFILTQRQFPFFFNNKKRRKRLNKWLIVTWKSLSRCDPGVGGKAPHSEWNVSGFSPEKCWGAQWCLHHALRHDKHQLAFHWSWILVSAHSGKRLEKPSGSLHQKHVDSLLWVWHRSEVSEGLLGQARQINLRKWRERMEWALAAVVGAHWSAFLLPLTSSGHSQTTKAYLCSVEKPLKWRRRGGASLSDAHLLQLGKTMSPRRR